VTARIIDGAEIAAQIRAEVAKRVVALTDEGVQPGLAAVVVGDDKPSHIYVGAKRKACADAGIYSEKIELPAFVTEAELLAAIRRLNRDPQIHGIIVQLPLPGHLSELATQRAIDPGKDVDGLHPMNVGLMVRGDPAFPPATPYGIVEMLLRSGVEIDGAEVVVVGYGPLVGAPLSILLAQDHVRGRATVTICHVHTRDLAAQTRRADILVAAAGVPRMITADMVRPGATVVDVGVHRIGDRLVGDVDLESVREVAGAITPVPGGVGPMTVAMLLVNTVTAAEASVFRS
jgi:methylenetetrahydrofolate dehydrogenase (NADP+)/methenyltetrahydrofolate cyclohydrolase